jgi:hypothetical protein
MFRRAAITRHDRVRVMHLGLKPAAGAVEKPKVPVPAKTVWIGGTLRRDSLDYRFQIHSRGMVSSPPRDRGRERNISKRNASPHSETSSLPSCGNSLGNSTGSNVALRNSVTLRRCAQAIEQASEWPNDHNHACCLYPFVRRPPSSRRCRRREQNGPMPLASALVRAAVSGHWDRRSRRSTLIVGFQSR